VALNNKRKKVKRRTIEGTIRPGILSHLGVIGIIGWSLLVPVLLGIAGGMWLDKTFKDAIPWSAILILVGLAAGVLNAWFWIVQNRNK
jgi:ATP synthase protein I